MAAVHFSTLPVTNAKPWSHPSLTLLQPRRRTLRLYLMLLSAAQVRPAFCDHVACSAWCFCPEASSPDSPQSRSCRPFLSLLKCPLDTGGSRPVSWPHKPLPYVTPARRSPPACLLTATLLSCLSLPGAGFACHLLCYVSGTHRTMVPPGGVGCKEGAPELLEWGGILSLAWVPESWTTCLHVCAHAVERIVRKALWDQREWCVWPGDLT